MKALTNWRYFAMAAILAAATALALADPKTAGAAEWAILFAASKAAAVLLFLALQRLTARWEAAGEIPEFTSLGEEE